MAIRKRTTITFNQGLRGRKGKLNMITSMFANKHVVERSFGSSSILGCSEKSSVITKTLSLILSWFLPVSKSKY